MLEYERAYTVEQALRVSPYSLGSVGGVCTLTDYYMEPVPVGGLGPAEAAPVCRVRLTADAAGERMEITLKLPTPDPHARLEYTYPVPAGSFRAGPDVARVSKTRYRLHTLRRQVGAPDSRIPDGVVCTLDVFSHPPGLPPVLELEGDPACGSRAGALHPRCVDRHMDPVTAALGKATFDGLGDNKQAEQQKGSLATTLQLYDFNASLACSSSHS